MLTTYKATLHGNKIKWGEDVLREVAQGKTVTVQITILDESPSAEKQGQQMTDVLSKVAKSHTFANLDAQAWEREKQLAGRDK